MKPWPKDAVALICCRKEDPYRMEVPGSIEKPCFNCSNTIVVSPATLNSAVKSEVVCLECYKNYTAGKPHIIVQTELQTKELESLK